MQFITTLLLMLLLGGCRTLGALSFSPNYIAGPSGDQSKHKSLISPKERTLMRRLDDSYDEVGEKCQELGLVKQTAKAGDRARREAFHHLRHKAVVNEADTIRLQNPSKPPYEEKVYKAKIYDCQRPEMDWKKILKDREEHRHNRDISLFGGSYFHRDGILERLGEVGPTFGLSATAFKLPKDELRRHGFFVLWTFDHFWQTNSKLLKPKFFDENYTNYMLAGGYAFRLIPYDWLQLHYKGGIAMNFIEIDTFGGGNTEKDKEYSDITISTIHKLTASFLIRDSDDVFETAPVRFGPSIFYYYAPNPLGKFSNDASTEQIGGSLAWSLDLIFEFY